MRAAAKMSPSSGSRLALADLQWSGQAAGPLRQGPNGVLETATIPYRSMVSSPVSVALRRNIEGRGFLTIEGLITKPSEAKRLPAGALKRQFFDPDNGREIDPSKDLRQIGDRLVVVLEGTSKAIPTVLGPDGTPLEDAGGDPLLVVDLLPSSFQVVSNAVFRQKDLLRSTLGELKPLGDLRSVEADPDRWVALIVPKSRRQRDEKPAEQGVTPPADVRKQPVEIEFRQGYLVQINMAGRFTLPAASIEDTNPPVKTLRADQSSIEIKLPDIPAR